MASSAAPLEMRIATINAPRNIPVLRIEPACQYASRDKPAKNINKARTRCFLLSCGEVNKGTYENCASQGMVCVNGECKQQATSLFKNMENQLADASRVISSLIEQIKDLIGR